MENIIINKMSDKFRTADEFIKAYQELQSQGGYIVIKELDIDTRRPKDKFALSLMCSLNAFEKELFLGM